MVPYLEIGVSNVLLYRNCRFQRIPILKTVVPMFFCLGTEISKVPYLEMGGSNGFLFGN